jgi:hypothetical protein
MNKMGLAIGGAFFSMLASGAQASELDGTWTSACTSQDNAKYIQTVTFAGTTGNVDQTIYTDANCHTAAYKAHQASDYVLAAAEAGTTAIDYTLTAVSIQVENSQYVAAFNAQRICGYSDWKVHVAKDVAGRSCGSGTIPSVGTKSYDVYQLDGSTLYFGATTTEQDGSTPAKRPPGVDNAVPFTKTAQ